MDVFGLSTTPERIKTLHAICFPKNLQKLKQYFGMTTYYATKFHIIFKKQNLSKKKRIF